MLEDGFGLLENRNYQTFHLVSRFSALNLEFYQIYIYKQPTSTALNELKIQEFRFSFWIRKPHSKYFGGKKQ